MIKYGNNCCVDEMIPVRELLYYYVPYQLAIRVTKNIVGHFAAEPLNNQDRYQIRFTEKPKLYKGIFHSGNIRILDKESKESCVTKLDPTNRICYECYIHKKIVTKLPLLVGYVPTYTIGLVGRPSVGKTAFFNSFLHNANECHLYSSKRFIEGKKKFMPTQKSQRTGLVEEIALCDKYGNYQAVIQLIDAPGEIVTTRMLDRNADYEFHRNRLLNCDALLYFMDYGQKGQEDGGDWLELLTDYVNMNRPLAVIMTKSDLLKKECVEKTGCLKKNGVPIVTSDYFDFQKRMPKTRDKALHIMKDKYIIRELFPVLRCIPSKRMNTAYFMVSSGEAVNGDSTVLDLDSAVNVTEVMNFVVGTLGIS